MHGLADLLQQIQPGLDRKIARNIAAAVLTHPMVRSAGSRYGSVIHREELATLLLQFAAEDSKALDVTAKQKLAEVLKANDIEDPAKVLQRVRDFLLQMELARPELAANARHSVALLEEASSRFLAKLNAWFDQTMDRVSERFTFTTRGVTFAMSLVVAIVLQLDTVTLVNRLAADPELRSALVSQAVELEKKGIGKQPASQSAPGAQATAQNPQDGQEKKPAAQEKAPAAASLEAHAENLRKLAAAEIYSIPKNYDDWEARWSAEGQPPTKVGVLLTAILLSFGAPFWYNALKNLLRLRSVLASKDDTQRQERETLQTAAAGAAPAAGAVPASGAAQAAMAGVGERGDLTSVG
jgi:hypothetical protein